jgi:hypothetical protein
VSMKGEKATVGPQMILDRGTAPRPFVLVLMPFAEELTDLYQLAVKAACEEVGAYCERVDEQVYDSTILDRIVNQIAKADIVVAEVSDRNPNVLYEVGYAHALGRRVVLVARNADGLPFDLSSRPHVIYGGRLTELRTKLAPIIKHWIEHPLGSQRAPAASFEVFLDDIRLREDHETVVPVPKATFVWHISIHNLASFPMIDSEIAVVGQGLRVLRPDGRGQGGWDELPKRSLPENVEMWILPIQRILPDDWHSEELSVKVSRSGGASVKVFTERGPWEFPIRIDFPA